MCEALFWVWNLRSEDYFWVWNFVVTFFLVRDFGKDFFWDWQKVKPRVLDFKSNNCIMMQKLSGILLNYNYNYYYYYYYYYSSRSGVYNFVPQRAQAGWNLVWSLWSCIFISLFICEVGVCRKWRHTAARSWPNGVRRRKTQIFGSEGRGFESCKVFFFPPFSFLFFFCFESWAFPFFRFSFWIKKK